MTTNNFYVQGMPYENNLYERNVSSSLGLKSSKAPTDVSHQLRMINSNKQVSDYLADKIFNKNIEIQKSIPKKRREIVKLFEKISESSKKRGLIDHSEIKFRNQSINNHSGSEEDLITDGSFQQLYKE